MKKWKAKAKEWLKSEILKINSDIALIATRLNAFNEYDIVIILLDICLYYRIFIIYYTFYIILNILYILCYIIYIYIY